MKNILGLKVGGHDPGAALISDTGIVAISEERLNRIKHSRGTFADLSIAYCLEALRISSHDVDLVVIQQDGPHFDALKKNYGEKFPRAEIISVNHHDAHAASAFFVSPFEEAAVLVSDGSGGMVKNHQGVTGYETETLYRGTDNKLYQIQKTTHINRDRHSRETIGIGHFYQLISEHYLNFGAYNEGKLMGLAPYGSKTVFDVQKAYALVGDYFVCNPRIMFEGSDKARKGWSKLSLRGKVSQTLRKWLIEFAYLCFKIAPRKGWPVAIAKSAVFDEIHLALPRRERNVPLPQEYYANVAYTAQRVFEEVMIGWGKRIRSITGLSNFALAGGCGLNIDANSKFLSVAGFENIFVQPAASDAGIALGAAFWGAHQHLNMPRFYEMKSASLGRVYREEEIKKAIAEAGDAIKVKKTRGVAEETARLIANGKIIGWFQGGGEYGPRALGNRSILCDARNKDMKDILNNRVKHRESWRPFAASVLAEKQNEWFEIPVTSPFMLLVGQVVEKKKKLVPSIVHVDGTCRVQSVTEEQNKPYYELLKEFHNMTGVPLLLNTSFNLGGEPIVETPADALNTFLRTEMDCLVIHDYIISKK